MGKCTFLSSDPRSEKKQSPNQKFKEVDKPGGRSKQNNLGDGYFKMQKKSSRVELSPAGKFVR